MKIILKTIPCFGTATKMTDKIIFFGTENFSALTLQQLLADGYKIEAVVTKPDFKRGRGKALEEPLVKKIAQKNSIPVLQPENSTELLEFLEPFTKSIGVLVSYGKIISENVIKLFTHGIINLHPSLLPKYRGPSPIETAILSGDNYTGVSIMLLDKVMDSGPVFAFEEVHVEDFEDAKDLYDKLGKIGAKLMSNVLPKIISGELQATPQYSADASYTKMLKKEDGLLDPTAFSANQLVQQIKAQIIYPKSFIQFNNERLIVKKAHASNHSEHALSVPTKDGDYLTIESLINKNGKLITANDYINSMFS